MTPSKPAGLAACLAMAAALAGCGGSSERNSMAAAYCPTTLTVQDAQRLIRFKPGPGRDPRDVMFEAQVVGAGTSCKMARNRMEVDVAMQIAVNAGPSVGQTVTQVPFFVRILDGRGNVVQGRDELADYKLSAASPRGASREQFYVELPFSQLSDIGGYRIAVGLKPTHEELEYNRRSASRP
ncbi:MAG: hypothetical protein KIT25_01705 [Enhydrobacter sp.]|nr:MAG: hypothetical protein KIT25_01705 [Enhydrobacter sp.]